GRRPDHIVATTTDRRGADEDAEDGADREGQEHARGGAHQSLFRMSYIGLPTSGMAPLRSAAGLPTSDSQPIELIARDAVSARPPATARSARAFLGRGVRFSFCARISRAPCPT